MMRNKKEEAVAEILGTILLMLIAALVMTIIYYQFLSDEGPQPETHVDIVGDIIKQNVTLTHKGGESIDADDKISITIGGEIEPFFIWELLDDENSNGRWDFGEKVLYRLNESDILENISQYEFIDVAGIDSLSNSLVFQGPVYTSYRSDVGLEVTVNNTHPVMGDKISVNIGAWCYGGDIAGAGNVRVNCSLPEGLDFISYAADQGTYDPISGVWNLGNLLVENSPVNLTIIVEVNGVPYHEPTQLGIIFEGSGYTSGSVSVWQNTYLSGLRFALNDDSIFPHDGSVELTVVTCGGNSPPLAEVELEPTIITEANYHDIGQDLRNSPYPGGYAPISSAIRLTTDQLYDSDSFSIEKRQIILLVSSGNPDCIWNEFLGNGYGADYDGNTPQVELDTINAAEYLNTTIDFNMENDELDAITVAKTVDLRNSALFNESIVMPKPGNIYDINNPIDHPGWVFEVEPGKDEFQEAFSLIIKLLLNSVRVQVNVDDSTTIDPNNGNDISIINIQPSFV